MQPRHHSVWKRYGAAFLLLLAGLTIEWILHETVGDQYAVAVLFLTLLLAAWFGGFGPAALLSVVGLLATALLFPQEQQPDDGGLVGIALYFAITFGIALLGAGMRAARSRAEAVADTARFLARASSELAGLVDLESTLQKIARLSVPYFADWCAVDIVQADGTPKRVAFAHVDPEKVALARELYDRFPPRPDAPLGVWRIIHTGESEMLPVISDCVLAETVTNPEQLEMVRRLGPRSYVGVPIQTRGTVLGTIAFLIAESGRRYGEADRVVAEDLAHRAAVAIENARLYEQVREADHRKDEFLAMLAHELRNPLAPIRTGLDLLTVSNTDPGDAETIGLMQRQVTHLARLVDDLLDVSRIVRGRIELHREQLSVADVVHRTAAAVRPSFHSREQQLDLQLPEEPLLVHGDAVRVAQILENLLNNASKYTPEGGRIDVSVTRHGEQAVIAVRDNGIGIEPELLPRVFDLFTQSSRALDRAHGGLGIGLTLVRNLVQLHGGSVTAESEGTGQGSVFTVRLPAVAADAETDEPAPTARRSPAPPRRVLIVDDNAGAARMLQLLIRQLGPHEVTEALDALRKGRPDVVLLDIGLPGMDGYEVCRAIRAQPGLNGIFVAALTGYGQEEDRRRSRDAGFDEHLVKPVPAEVLEALLAASAAERSRR